MHGTVRDWITKILEERKLLVALAVRQRAKFEGWLKFELAYRAALAGASDVEVESGSTTRSGQVRADIAFRLGDAAYSVELKTPNTNWRMPGVQEKTRPITNNIAEIVSDGQKLASQPSGGIVAFVLFPVPIGDRRWVNYLQRISSETGVSLNEREHTARVNVPLVDGTSNADLVVCAFTVPHSA